MGSVWRARRAQESDALVAGREELDEGGRLALGRLLLLDTYGSVLVVDDLRVGEGRERRRHVSFGNVRHDASRVCTRIVDRDPPLTEHAVVPLPSLSSLAPPPARPSAPQRTLGKRSTPLGARRGDGEEGRLTCPGHMGNPLTLARTCTKPGVSACQDVRAEGAGRLRSAREDGGEGAGSEGSGEEGRVTYDVSW